MWRFSGRRWRDLLADAIDPAAALTPAAPPETHPIGGADLRG